MSTLDPARIKAVETLCEQIVPGSSAVGPAVYVDAALGGMPDDLRRFALHAIDVQEMDQRTTANFHRLFRP